MSDMLLTVVIAQAVFMVMARALKLIIRIREERTRVAKDTELKELSKEIKECIDKRYVVVK